MNEGMIQTFASLSMIYLIHTLTTRVDHSGLTVSYMVSDPWFGGQGIKSGSHRTAILARIFWQW